MREIPLTRGYTAIVDDEDYEALAQYRWCALVARRRNLVYAVRGAPRAGGGRQLIYMHRVVAGSMHGQHTDHANGDTLDNRRTNLRKCTNAENRRNGKTPANNTSGYKGVAWFKKERRWVAQISIHGHTTRIGAFTCPIEAARAYDRKAIELYGEFARPNFGG